MSAKNSSIHACIEQNGLCRSPEAMQQLAEDLSALLDDEAILALEGDLGVGKTTFVKGLARAWGIETAITSPTFNIYSVYQGERTLLHADAYRLEGAESFENMMPEDFVHTPYCMAIEWPEKIVGWFPENTLWLRFEIVEPGVHRISMNADNSD